MSVSMNRTIAAWLNHKSSKKESNKKTDGTTIFYYDNAIARWNDDGTFSINTAEHSDSRTTRMFINDIIHAVYGDNSPYLFSDKGAIYMRFPESNEQDIWLDGVNGNGWFAFTDKENYI